MPIIPGRSLRSRLIAGLCLLFLSLLIIVCVTAFSINSLLFSVNEIVKEYTEELAPTDRLENQIAETSFAFHGYILEVHSEKEKFRDLAALVEENYLASFERPFGAPSEQRDIRESYRHWRKAVLVAEALLENVEGTGRAGGYAEKMALFENHLNNATNLLEGIQSAAYREIDEELNSLKRIRDRNELVVLFSVGAAVAVSLFMVRFIGRSVIRPLQVLEDGAARLRAGDLEHRVPVESRDEMGRLALSFNRMARRLNQNHEELKRLSTRDYLTDLDNAREFYHHLEEELERAGRYRQPFSLLIVDTDHFKKINDSYGHQAGDRVLKEVAGLLRGSVRSGDRLARIGGEEFGIILPMTDGASALQMGERIRRAVAEAKILIDEKTEHLHCTVSVGCASFPEDAEGGKELFARADHALYAAKRTGRNRVCSAAEGAEIPLPRAPDHLTSGGSG